MSLLTRPKSSKASAGKPRVPVSVESFPETTPDLAKSELWIDKYAPRARKDLAMHKKKVDEVAEWLQRADISLQLGLPPTPRILVLSGPTGTGKSAMLRVLAAEMNFETYASNSVHNLVEALKGQDPRTQALVSEIKVNALADGLLTKTLLHIASQERLDIPSAALTSIVSNANGDLRNAVHSMQFIATGLTRLPGAPTAAMRVKGSKRTLGASTADARAAAPDAAAAASGGSDRDRFPDMFHAIGSIIHRPAKRAKLLAERASKTAQEQRAPQQHAEHQGSSAGASGTSASECAAGVVVAPTEVEDGAWSAEGVIESCALEEPSAACFLHQNYLESFTEIDDLAAAAGCLSDANVLVDAQRRRPWQTPLLPYVASFAGRGLVTHNRHPAPSRFMQTRKPQVFAVEKESLERRRRAVSAFRGVGAIGAIDGSSIGSAALVSEGLPFLRLIIAQRSGASSHELTAAQWQSVMEMSAFGRAGVGPPPPAIYRPIPAISCTMEPRCASSAPASVALLADEIEES